MSDNNVIEIRGIIRDFKLGQETVHVLKGIDLDIIRGEYVAIMGPSGSGKTTFLNIAGLLETFDGGSYELGGEDVSHLPCRFCPCARGEFLLQHQFCPGLLREYSKNVSRLVGFRRAAPDQSTQLQQAHR